MVDDFQKLKEQNKKLRSKKDKRESKAFLGSKVLKKPNVQLVQDLSARKAVLQGTGNLALVREVEQPPQMENRSLFFSDSFVKEKKESNKWLRD